MATRKALVPHILTANGVQIAIDQSETDYQGVGDIVGIKKMPDNSKVTAAMTVSQVQANGLAVRLRVRLKNKKSNYLLCAMDKVSSAIPALKGKAMNQSTVVSAGIPRKRSRR